MFTSPRFTPISPFSIVVVAPPLQSPLIEQNGHCAP
ncbi:hypothetical protein HNQ50_003676 [Silvimonas terrae]|uniref:Uncharacterized protein n=1 Tax=Silvimonas terrae TaxID=300266 RepID=A0A840RL30_9NEIS|nr:hypothetical protein [Silvimonas terrae]